MHELGIVTYVVKTVEKIAEENQVEKIAAVTLEIGEVSGVVEEYLEDCWKYFREKNPILEDAALEFEILPAVTWCEDCKTEYETVKYGRTCPHCCSENTFLLAGGECNIKEILAV
ncbi:MAG: hydrogenase maturation nickel metallochaperone HypA [Anaerovoracaceae bacterium]